MTKPELQQTLRLALVNRFGANPNELQDNTLLFSGGVIDSLSVMELVHFVQGEIMRPIPTSDITLANFDSIARIVEYVTALPASGNAT
jgi:acyl carrier protein